MFEGFSVPASCHLEWSGPVPDNDTANDHLFSQRSEHDVSGHILVDTSVAFRDLLERNVLEYSCFRANGDFAGTTLSRQ